ncbi:MAG: hypothetical protein CMJ75_07590 [Planctomycetaceae bacterium]|nr:hypothetical protein [Planctomycetaceae bacterium]
MRTQEKIGVAIVGLGIGEKHAHAYHKMDNCVIHWFYDLSYIKAKVVADELGQGRVAASFEEVLHDPKVQIISIASYDSAHFEQVVAALDAGKHVFVEKPICRTIDELEIVKRAWIRHKNKLILSSNLVLRSAPLYQWLKNKIESKVFGEIYAFDGDYLYGRLHKITQGWRKNEANYSVMLGGGIHLVDLMLWLTGENPTSVYASGNEICTQSTSFGYYDHISALLTFPSSMVGRITSHFGCVHRHHHVVRIFGTEATFIYDDSGPRLHQKRDSMGLASPVHHPALPNTKGDLIPAFVDAVVCNSDWSQHTQNMFDVISVCVACDAAVLDNSSREVEYA